MPENDDTSILKPLIKGGKIVEGTILNRFVNRLKLSFQAFQIKPSDEKLLIGRIQDLYKTADLVLHELQEKMKALRGMFDAEVGDLIDKVSEPLYRDIERIKHALHHQSSAVQQAQTFKKYLQWIEKSRYWIRLASGNHSKEVIIDTLMMQMVIEFLECIDRDLQIIQDYQKHRLENLSISSELKQELLEKLEKILYPYLQNLKRLKAAPKIFQLSDISPWKIKIDKRREKYFDGALHIIDKIIEEFYPETATEEGHEHLVAVLSQVAYLEEEIQHLKSELSQQENWSPLDSSIFEARFLSLEEEIHHLNLDLRITPEVFDRLQVLIQDLLAIQELYQT